VADLFDQRRPFGRLALTHVLMTAGDTLFAVSLAGSLFFSISPTAAQDKVILYLVLTMAPFAVVAPALAREDGRSYELAQGLDCAEDPRAPTPTRLDLAGPDEAAAAWLAHWAEDVEQVRRRLTVRRFDDVEITLIATIASFGGGVATSLAVESIRAQAGGAILRSGVHPRAEVDAALALRSDPGDLP